jgi:hypothetical protein
MLRAEGQWSSSSVRERATERESEEQQIEEKQADHIVQQHSAGEKKRAGRHKKLTLHSI